MTNIYEFKNKLQEYQERTDYIYNEEKKTHTIYHEELKKTFWGDSSNEVEYKAIEDSRGNIQFRKSAIFRSSKSMKEESNHSPSIHSIEKMRDKQWREENLGNFSKETNALNSTSDLENSNKNDFQEKGNFSKENEEEFGYYREWRPFEEPTNTVYHWKREGDNYFEKKAVWKDNNSQNLTDFPEIQAIADKETEQTKTENSSNSDKKHQKKDKLTANQQSSLQDKDNNHQNIYYGVGLISLVLLVISMVVVWMKKKR